ncbi:hypothetical protein C8039_05430 [Halogeometricum sp. wsp3]|nr:hypothetical protein C8039_05430 [Halogeometricum sp. wsp3]
MTCITHGWRGSRQGATPDRAGDPVTGRPVRLQIGAGGTRRVETNRNGSFRPSSRIRRATADCYRHVRRAEDKPRNATATATLAAGSGGGNPPVGSDGNPAAAFGNAVIGSSWLPVFGGGVALAVVVAAWFVVPRVRQSRETDSPVPTETGDTSMTTQPIGDVVSETTPTFEDRAESYLDTELRRRSDVAYTAVHDVQLSKALVRMPFQRSQEQGVPRTGGRSRDSGRTLRDRSVRADIVDRSLAEAAVERAP